MSKSRPAFERVPFPRMQRQMIDWLALSHRQHTVHALLEVDVTQARQEIRAYRRRTGTPLSLTAFVTACLARAIGENRAMHAYRQGHDQLILFDDVDVTMVVEQEMEGQKIPLPHVIRAANTKSPSQIHQEIRSAQAAAGEHTYHVRLLPLWLLLPAFVRRFIWARLLCSPQRRKQTTGTVIVTALGMFGSGTGWGIPLTDYTLGLTVGGVARKPGVVGDEISIREYLCLTISMNHDVIDGAPAARFIHRLTELIESGAGLAPAPLRSQSAPDPAGRVPS